MASPEDLCLRCMQPVPRSAHRCPNCGVPHTSSRRLTLWAGAAILLILVLLAAFLAFTTRGTDSDKSSQQVFVLVPARV
jgi:RNA polymerase subunit RPABC4/transcription elongation factor Spt4